MKITTDKKESRFYKDISEIVIPFPEMKYRDLLEKFNIKAEDSHININARKIFIASVKSFLKGSFSLDDLANISGKLWYNRHCVITDELGSALYAASELSFYVRRIYNPDLEKEEPNQFFNFMNQVMAYYSKYGGAEKL